MASYLTSQTTNRAAIGLQGLVCVISTAPVDPKNTFLSDIERPLSVSPTPIAEDGSVRLAPASANYLARSIYICSDDVIAAAMDLDVILTVHVGDTVTIPNSITMLASKILRMNRDPIATTLTIRERLAF